MRVEDVDHQGTVLFPTGLDECINVTGEFWCFQKRYFSGISDIKFTVTAHLICMI